MSNTRPLISLDTKAPYPTCQTLDRSSTQVPRHHTQHVKHSTAHLHRYQGTIPNMSNTRPLISTGTKAPYPTCQTLDRSSPQVPRHHTQHVKHSTAHLHRYQCTIPNMLKTRPLISTGTKAPYPTCQTLGRSSPQVPRHHTQHVKHSAAHLHRYQGTIPNMSNTRLMSNTRPLISTGTKAPYPTCQTLDRSSPQVPMHHTQHVKNPTAHLHRYQGTIPNMSNTRPLISTGTKAPYPTCQTLDSSFP